MTIFLLKSFSMDITTGYSEISTSEALSTREQVEVSEKKGVKTMKKKENLFQFEFVKDPKKVKKLEKKKEKEAKKASKKQKP